MYDTLVSFYEVPARPRQEAPHNWNGVQDFLSSTGRKHKQSAGALRLTTAKWPNRTAANKAAQQSRCEQSGLTEPLQSKRPNRAATVKAAQQSRYHQSGPTEPLRTKRPNRAARKFRAAKVKAAAATTKRHSRAASRWRRPKRAAA